MPYIHPDLISRIKQIDLLAYLQTYDPEELVHAGGGEYCTKTHDSLRISHGLWCWHSRGIGGKTALDYLIKVRGMNFMNAAQHLLGQTAIDPLRQTATTPSVFSCPPKPPPKRTLRLPPAAPDNNRILAYLQSRGIASAVLEHCVESGRLYESADYHNCVFVGLDKSGQPRHAALRGIGSSFKGEAKGSDKRYSFSLPAEAECTTLHLFESAIDALSYATLFTMHRRDWRQAHLLSLAGVFAPGTHPTKSADFAGTPVNPNKRLPVSLARYLEDYPEIQRIDLHLDNDIAGRAAAQNIMELLGGSFEVRNRSPPTGKDVNEYLVQQLGLRHNSICRKEGR